MGVRKARNPDAHKAPRFPGNDRFGRLIDPQASTLNVHDLQAQCIARWFGLEPVLAKTIAELAFAEASR
jgi:hypothetical protein